MFIGYLLFGITLYFVVNFIFKVFSYGMPIGYLFDSDVYDD